MKIIRHPKARAMLVSPDECKALKQAEDVLSDLQFAFGKDATVMSIETGEIILGEEIVRARAVLNFIHNYRAIELV